jgi:hypothetical protein
MQLMQAPLVQVLKLDVRTQKLDVRTQMKLDVRTQVFQALKSDLLTQIHACHAPEDHYYISPFGDTNFGGTCWTSSLQAQLIKHLRFAGALRTYAAHLSGLSCRMRPFDRTLRSYYTRYEYILCTHCKAEAEICMRSVRSDLSPSSSPSSSLFLSSLSLPLPLPLSPPLSPPLFLSSLSLLGPATMERVFQFSCYPSVRPRPGIIILLAGADK